MKKKKTKKVGKLYFLVVQDISGTVLQILSSYNYDSLMIEGMELAKEQKAFWTILDSNSNKIDGSFTVKEKTICPM